MSRKLSFTPYRKNDRWAIQVPARFSDNGKQRTLYFRTKSAAQEEQRRLLDMVAQVGERKICLSPQDADELQRVLSALGQYGVSLEEVINDWRYAVNILHGTGYTVRTAADALRMRLNNELGKPLAEVVEAYLSQLSGRSKQYMNTVRKFSALMVSEFDELRVDEIEPLAFQTWLEAVTKTDYYFSNVLRGLKPIFSWAVRMGLAQRNPVENVKPKRIITGAPDVLTLEQVHALLSACRDYFFDFDFPDELRKNCTDALPAVAILLFAGVRPQELARLTWGDVFLDKRIIKISAHASKTSSVRLVSIEDNLLDFLYRQPKHKPTEKIIPRDWGRKWKAIRKGAGIGDMQDVCRHTYASYWLAKHENMDRLLLNMGHTTNKVTLKHYLTACEKYEADKFWSIKIR